MSTDDGDLMEGWPHGHVLATPVWAEGRSWRFRDGLRLYCLDQSFSRQRGVRVAVPGGCVHVALSLEGRCRLRLGGQALPLYPVSEGAPCTGLAVYLETDEWLEGVLRSGALQRLLVVSLPRASVGTAFERRCLDHLRICRWRPSVRAHAIAEQLLSQQSHNGVSQRLMVESRVLELLAEALVPVVCQGACAATGLHPGAHVRAGRLRSLIEKGVVDDCSLGEIAARMCCNVTTLQQQFRAAYGSTIIEFRRVSRLERAAQALRHEGVSVAQAAEIAGYSSQANFSTAFRRHFGQVPKHVRERV